MIDSKSADCRISVIFVDGEYEILKDCKHELVFRILQVNFQVWHSRDVLANCRALCLVIVPDTTFFNFANDVNELFTEVIVG